MTIVIDLNSIITVAIWTVGIFGALGIMVEIAEAIGRAYDRISEWYRWIRN